MFPSFLVPSPIGWHLSRFLCSGGQDHEQLNFICSHLCFSVSSMVSGRRMFNVSGSRKAAEPHSTAMAQYVTWGRSFHTVSSRKTRGATEPPRRATKEQYPSPFCLEEKQRYIQRWLQGIGCVVENSIPQFNCSCGCSVMVLWLYISTGWPIVVLIQNQDLNKRILILEAISRFPTPTSKPLTYANLLEKGENLKSPQQLKQEGFTLDWWQSSLFKIPIWQKNL